MLRNTCKDKYFHTFEYRCKYDLNFEHKISGDLFYFKIAKVFKLFSSQSDRLHEKVVEYEKTDKNSTKN